MYSWHKINRISGSTIILHFFPLSFGCWCSAYSIRLNEVPHHLKRKWTRDRVRKRVLCKMCWVRICSLAYKNNNRFRNKKKNPMTLFVLRIFLCDFLSIGKNAMAWNHDEPENGEMKETKATSHIEFIQQPTASVYFQHHQCNFDWRLWIESLSSIITNDESIERRD